MKGKFFFLILGATLAFIMMILGVLAILDVSNLDLANWAQDFLGSKIGKIVWIVVSMSCFFVFVMLAANVHQKYKEIYMLRLGENKLVLMTNLKNLRMPIPHTLQIPHLKMA